MRQVFVEAHPRRTKHGVVEVHEHPRRIFKKGKYHYTLATPTVVRYARNIKTMLKPYARRIELAGSIRRKVWLRNKPVIDIDIVMIPKNLGAKEKVASLIKKFGTLISCGDHKLESRVWGVKVDIFFAENKNWGAMILFATGSGPHNIGLRKKAMAMGLKLNQYGLWKDGRCIASESEFDIYKALNRPRLKKPEERD